MKSLVTHMAQAIVDYPDQVVVTEEMAEDHIVYHLTVADSDMALAMRPCLPITLPMSESAPVRW